MAVTRIFRIYRKSKNTETYLRLFLKSNYTPELLCQQLNKDLKKYKSSCSPNGTTTEMKTKDIHGPFSDRVIKI